MAAKKKPASGSSSSISTSARGTVSGPSNKERRRTADAAVAKAEATEALAAERPFNPNKPDEFGRASAAPKPGATAKPKDVRATGSTLTEGTASKKTGAGKPNLGTNPGNLSLDRVRVDSSDRVLTTNQGVPVGDNQNSLKAGLRGPTLLEDFILREKITHFDHERIPERIVQRAARPRTGSSSATSR